MTIATTTEQRDVCEAISGWAARRELLALVRADLDDPGDRWTGLWPEIAELGLFAAAVPDGAGGLGADAVDLAVMLAESGRRLVPGPLAATVTAAVALAEAAGGGELLEGLLDGRVFAAVPALRDVEAAVPVIDGAARLGKVPGYAADAVLLAPLQLPGEEPAWFLIPEPAAHRRVGEATGPVDGTAPAREVALSDVDPRRLLPLPDRHLVEGMLALARTAYASGVARWSLDTAVDYAKVRTQFGSPIGSFQAIKHICAEMLCRSEQVGAAAWDLAVALDDYRADGCRTDEDRSGTAAEQLVISRAAAEVLVAELPIANAKDCIQVLGGIGFTFEHDAHLYLRSAMAVRAVLRSGAPGRRHLARAVLDGGRRRFEIDLSSVADRRPAVAERVAAVAAADPAEARRLLAESGYLVPHWPEPYGLAADPALQLLIDAELDAAGVKRPDLVIGGWAVPTLLEHGTEAQRERFAGPTLAGDIVWCQLFSEPEAGSDLASLRTRAERVDGGWRLTGQKVWTSQAHNAHWAICLARTDPEAPKHKGITYFLVDMAAEGIDIRPLRELTGRAMFNEVFLEGVFVPDDCVVGEVNHGWRLARTTLANERVAMGGSGLGKEMDALLAQLADSADGLDEVQLDGLGRLLADAHIGRVLDARTVVTSLAGGDPGVTSSVRKLIGVAHRQQVPEFALDLLGPDGLVESRAGELFLLNRCLSIAGGTTQILRTAAAERILGLPR